MKALKKISEQIREGITQFIEAVDGSKSFVDQAILDMKARLAAAKDLVATGIAEAQRLKRAYQDAIDTAETWNKKAADALQKGDHVRANEAQQHKQRHLRLADDYKRQIADQEAVVVRLKTALHEFYRQFQDAVKRAETLCQRQKQADTRLKLYKLLFDEIGNDVSKAFKQAEQKLKTTEIEAEMWEDKTPPTLTEVETTGDTSNLDQALADLKDDVLGQSSKMINLLELTKYFGKLCAVDALTLQVDAGEIFGFLGPNGAGKTTTINMLTGLLRPTSGTATLGGYDIQKQSLQAKAILGLMPGYTAAL